LSHNKLIIVNIKEIHSSPHHPQTNGQIERANKDVKYRLVELVAQGKGPRLDEELQKIIATQNTIRHKTTGHIPLEIHRGRLMHRPEDMNLEEEEKVIAHMRKEVVENLKKAAEKAKTRWTRNKRVKTYKVGEKVWVRQVIKSKRKGKIWQRTATIERIKGNHSYRLRWGDEGGYDTKEKPNSISFHFWNGRDLKPRIERTPSPSPSASDADYEEEELEDDDENTMQEEEREEIPPPTPPQRPKRLAKRKNKQGVKRKHEEERAPITTSTSTTQTATARSLSSFFAENGVESVDRSLKKARKPRTEK
jgi:hypothetical protein